jgi:dTDP-L-rhamnose 4-epimerase
MADRVLITGGAGFIGHKTANELANRGFHVRVLDNLNKQVHPNPKESLARLHPDVEFICGDIRNRSAVQEVLEGVEVVYHFAAETGVGQSMYEIERYSEVTIQGTAVLCDCIANDRKPLKKIILSSSRAVYGEGQYKCVRCGIVYPKGRSKANLIAGNWNTLCPDCGNEISPIPCQETTPRHPVSIYGFTKKVQEDMLFMISDAYNIPAVILRYFNVFGAGQSTSNPYTGILSIFCSLLLSNKSVEIYEDGQMIRDFVPIEDVVNANLKAIDFDVPSPLVLNIGSGNPKTILQVSEYLKEYIDSESNISISGRYRIGDIRHCYADVSKQNKFIGNALSNSFSKEIKSLIDWAREGKKSIFLEQSISELSNLGLSGVAACRK